MQFKQASYSCYAAGATAQQRCACCGHERQSQKRLVQELIVGSLDARWMQSMKAYTSVKLVKTAKGRVDAAQRRPTPATTRLDRTSGAICPKSSYLYAQSLDESVELSQRAFGAAAAVLLCGDDLVGSLDTGECHGGPNFKQSITSEQTLGLEECCLQ
jgi:hypothetical protein